MINYLKLVKWYTHEISETFHLQFFHIIIPSFHHLITASN